MIDFTKIRGNKKARFNVGDLVVCIVSKEPYPANRHTGEPGWLLEMDYTVGQVMCIESRYTYTNGCITYYTNKGWWYKPEWLIPAYDPENTLKVSEPVMYRYGEKAYLRTVKSIVGSYCELDNGSVFHHSKLFNLTRAQKFMFWNRFWNEGLGLGGSIDSVLCHSFRDRSLRFNLSSDDYNLSA